MGIRRSVVVGLFAAIVASCGSLATTPNLGARNGTTIDVAIVVNNVEIGRLAPGESIEGVQDRAGSLPWLVQLRTTESGRAVLTMRLEPAELDPAVDANGVSVESGSLTTVDLSCGRLEVWTGDRSAVGAGPPPGAGRPGDCER
jgi:hypothetical protein